MAVIRTLDILLRGKTEGLGKDFKNAESKFKSFSGRVNSILRAAIPVLSVAGFTAAIRSSLNDLDRIAKQSRAFGFDPAEFVAIERAARLAGVGIQSLSKANRTLQQRLDGAITRGGQQAKTFERLGLSAEKLSRLTTTEQLLEIGKAFDEITDRTQRTALAIDIFGRDGASVLNLISNGAEDLKKSLSETQRLGGVFTPSELAKVEAANDAISDLSFTFSNIFKRAAVELAPTIKKIADNLTEALKPGTAFNGALSAITETIKVLLVPIQLLVSGVRALSEFFGSSIGRLIGFAIATAVISRVTRSLITTLRILRTLQASILAIESARASLNLATAGRVAIAVAAFAAITAAVNGLEASIVDTFKEVDKLDAKFDQLNFGGTQTIQINPRQAARGSQEAFETIFGVRSEAPIAELIDVNRQGNAILAEIEAKLDGAEQLPDQIIGAF